MVFVIILIYYLVCQSLNLLFKKQVIAFLENILKYTIDVNIMYT